MRSYLRELRDKSGFTQLDTSRKLDISESYYSLIENGERKKSLDLSLAIKISKLFNVSVDYIIAEEEKLKNCGAG
jgi:transcriptional regulator with XRE-family HTH domain